MIKYLLIIPCIFLLISCENTTVIENDIPVQDIAVVCAELNPGTTFTGVTFTKMLPIGVTYNIKDAELKDVIAYMRINNAQIIPLLYTADGLYKPLYDLFIRAGNVYELFAEWGGNKIYSSTKVPSAPVVNNVSFNSGCSYLQADVSTRAGEVYGAVYVIGFTLQANTFPYLSIPDAGTTNITVITSRIPDKYLDNNYNGKRNIQVFSYDNQYTAYFNSARVNVPLGNAFFQSGGATAWNVYGNNVIGMFIGIARGQVRNVN
jgi:hypothetical protein